MSQVADQFLEDALIYAENIVNTIREPLVVLDTSLQIKTANRSFYRFFQVSPDEAEHHSLYELGNGQWDIPQLRDLLEQVVYENVAFEDFEVEHNFQHIGCKVMLLNAQQILQNSNKPMLILLAIEDITQRKQIEQELKLFSSKLEQSNRELQDFAYVASHDLQEPLRKIQAFGDLLKHEYGESLPEEAQDYVQRIQNATARMQILINDLLTFARVTTKAQPFVSINLTQIAQEVLIDLEVQIHDQDGAVDLGELPPIEADPLQMRQLFQNLISNGLKFHQPEIPPKITISAQLLQRPLVERPDVMTEWCQLQVTDNGIGFDEKYLHKIFTVFQRLHYRDKYQGTGVGLAICRKIVERHQGTITAKSSPLQGATFIVTLPVKQN